MSGLNLFKKIVRFLVNRGPRRTNAFSRVKVRSSNGLRPILTQPATSLFAVSSTQTATVFANLIISIMNEIIHNLQGARSIPLDSLNVAEILASLERPEAIDVLARNIALSFLAGSLTYSASFDLTQQLVRLSNFNLSSYTWGIFDAFACGAYRSNVYPVDLDPVAQYTIPSLRRILNICDEGFFVTSAFGLTRQLNR
ncbi:hypothetical protein [Burkholderia pseudomultivorans]|uniref:hypothetical protein n=1 Tax=Burkholderia pseudomultivorans TaxID=1207504 RepID=UPI0012D89D9F|nr:hypothetical protein [Burkholderia pseudomultivorans]